MSGTTKIVVGDITKLNTDAIVNAANMFLTGGSGVDGAIRRAAGTKLNERCMEFPELEHGTRCRTSEVRVTPGFYLPAKFVIHTVGPVYIDGVHGESERLGDCYRNCLDAARIHGCRSVAFPCISAGVFGAPRHFAATVAVYAVHNYMRDHEDHLDVLFCCFDEDMGSVYRSVIGSDECIVKNRGKDARETSPETRATTVESDLVLYANLGEIPPCPYCGRTPKIKTTDGPEGARSTVSCRSAFSKHISVHACAAEPWWAEAKAKKAWIDEVDEYWRLK